MFIHTEDVCVLCLRTLYPTVTFLFFSHLWPGGLVLSGTDLGRTVSCLDAKEPLGPIGFKRGLHTRCLSAEYDITCL